MNLWRAGEIYRPHEILWLLAALELKGKQRKLAYRDIALMSDRTIISVSVKANRLARGILGSPKRRTNIQGRGVYRRMNTSSSVDELEARA